MKVRSLKHYMWMITREHLGAQLEREMTEASIVMFRALQRMRFVPAVIDLYHDPLDVKLDRLPKLDGLLAFAFYKKFPLVQRAVVPLRHTHVGGHPIFITTEPIIRVEDRGERRYYMRCGSSVCRLDVDRWQVHREETLDVRRYAITMYTRASHSSSVYELLSSLSVCGLRTAVDVARGLLRQYFGMKMLYRIYLSYVGLVPERAHIVSSLLKDVPVGKCSCVYDVQIRTISSIKDENDVLLVPIAGEKMYVLTRMVPRDAIPPNKVIFPVEMYSKPIFPYRKGVRESRTICYRQGTILADKVRLV